MASGTEKILPALSQNRGDHLQSECSSCSLDVPTLNTRRPDRQENGKTGDRESSPEGMYSQKQLSACSKPFVKTPTFSITQTNIGK